MQYQKILDKEANLRHESEDTTTEEGNITSLQNVYSILQVTYEDSQMAMLAQQAIHQIGAITKSKKAIRIFLSSQKIPPAFKPITDIVNLCCVFFYSTDSNAR